MADELRELASFGKLNTTDLLNPGSKGFKELGLALENISEQEAADLIYKHPKIMRRPLLTDGNSLVVGFNPDHYAAMV